MLQAFLLPVLIMGTSDDPEMEVEEDEAKLGGSGCASSPCMSQSSSKRMVIEDCGIDMDADDHDDSDDELGRNAGGGGGACGNVAFIPVDSSSWSSKSSVYRVAMDGAAKEEEDKEEEEEAEEIK